MGIGNPGPYTFTAALAELITPHGDRELRPASPMWNSASTHYPSWGSGTLLAALFELEEILVSLPLMGIGNSLFVIETTRAYPNSLPLMGIGNLAGDRA